MAKPDTYESALDLIWERKIRPIMIDRQRKYGDSNIADTGFAGIVTRASDKTARLRNFLNGNGKAASDESIEDTLIDLAGYGLIGLMWTAGWWGLPMNPCTCELLGEDPKYGHHLFCALNPVNQVVHEPALD